MDMAPGPGEYHGCPYRHFDADHLAAVLSKTSLDSSEQQLVLGKAKERNYQIACQRHFEFAHKKKVVNGTKVVANLDGVGNHPNAFFKASRLYHQDVHAAEHPEEAKAEELERSKGIAAANQGLADDVVLAN
jgi:DNA primase large subunit